MKRILALALAVLFALSLPVCAAAEKTIPVKSLKAAEKKVTVPFGGEWVPKVTVKPDNATDPTVLWTSSDPSVLTVDEAGTARAVGAGDCELIGTAADGSGKTVKISVHVPVFDTAESSWEVTSAEGLVIPVDLHGLDVSRVTCKASKESFFMYWLDPAGLHVIPLAAGSASVTLSSALDKKDSAKYSITVTESAVAGMAEGPLRVVLAIGQPQADPGKKAKVRYCVMGGKQPYRSDSCSIRYINDIGQVSSSPKITAFPSGEITDDVPLGYHTLKAELTVADADGNYAQAYSNTVAIDHLGFMPAEECYAVRRGEKLEIPYRISGGSGSYTLKYHASVQTADGKKEKTKEVSGTAGASGVISLDVPRDADSVTVYMGIWDKKNKKLFVAYNGITAKVTDGLFIAGSFDRDTARAGEELTFSFRMEGAALSDVDAVIFRNRDTYRDVYVSRDDLRDEGNGVWSAVVVPAEAGLTDVTVSLVNGLPELSARTIRVQEALPAPSAAQAAAAPAKAEPEDPDLLVTVGDTPIRESDPKLQESLAFWLEEFDDPREARSSAMGDVITPLVCRYGLEKMGYDCSQMTDMDIEAKAIEIAGEGIEVTEDEVAQERRNLEENRPEFWAELKAGHPDDLEDVLRERVHSYKTSRIFDTELYPRWKEELGVTWTEAGEDWKPFPVIYE